MATPAVLGQVKIDGVDISPQVGEINESLAPNTVSTTNMSSDGVEENNMTTVALNLSFTIVNPEADASVASYIPTLIKAGLPTSSLGGGGGAGTYVVIWQKVSPGGTAGTATTKDPIKTATFTLGGDVAVIVGDPSVLVNQGSSLTFALASASSYSEATS